MFRIKMLVAVMFLLGSFCYVTALQCYQCTSLNNTKCADPFSANDTFSECPPPPEHISQNYTEAQLCRKLKQTIDGHIRITRSCGFILEDDKTKDGRCFKDAFTAYTNSYYCSCIGNNCNRSQLGAKLNKFLIISVVLFATTNYIRSD